MPPLLPTRPTQDITKISATWIAKLLDCVAYAMTHPAADGMTIKDNGGSHSVVRPYHNTGNGNSGTAAYSGPFAASAVTEDNINNFNIASGTFWTSYIGAPIAQTAHAPVANNKTIAYLKLEKQQTTGIFFCIESALPANTATKAIYPLAECITDANGNITTVTQRHYGDLYPYGRII
jgi:hypothetical protein